MLLSETERWCADHEIHILTPPEFPERLREIPNPPKRLFLRGNKEVLQQSLFALVGTRRPSAYGLQAAHFFSRGLVEAGLILVSGLAAGIDSVAHACAVLAKRPTIAVLGHGLDRIYPAQNRGLAEDIVHFQGCLITEYPPGTPPHPSHFPQRNRLISGLSVGALLVEAGRKSGSLITARHCLDQNRDVFVVPGPYNEASFQGSHWLLQQGAKLVTFAQDILEDLKVAVLPSMTESPESSTAGKVRHFFKMQGVASLDEIFGAVGGSLAQVQQVLELAEEAGWVREAAPQIYVYAG